MTFQEALIFWECPMCRRNLLLALRSKLYQVASAKAFPKEIFCSLAEEELALEFTKSLLGYLPHLTTPEELERVADEIGLKLGLKPRKAK